MKGFFTIMGLSLATLLLQVWMVSALWIDGTKSVAIAFLILQLAWLVLLTWGKVPRWSLVSLLGRIKKSRASVPSRTASYFSWTLLMFLGVGLWWFSLRPSDHRAWSMEYEKKPQVKVESGTLKIENYRDFQYPQDGLAVPSWKRFEAPIEELETLDLFLDYWGSPYIAHPMLSFGFKDGRHVVFSIETRRESHETYSAVKGFFRQFELIYLAGSESDLLNLRVHQRKEHLYWYPIQVRKETMQATLLEFVKRCQELEARPEFYHALTSNCSTNLRAQSERFRPWDYRVLLNGLMDEMLDERGLFEPHLGVPFQTYKSTRLLDRRLLDRAATGVNFSKQIRQALVKESSN